MMLLTLVSFLLAVHLPLPAMTAPNLNTNQKNRRPTSNTPNAAASLMQVHSAFLLNPSTSSKPTLFPAPPPAAQLNRTLCHGNVNSASSGGRAFRESKTGSAAPFRNTSHHGQVWNISLSSSKTTVTVTSCSEPMPESTPEPECSCPQLQTATIFVTVTATDYLSYPSSSKVGGQTLPSPLITFSGHNSALKSGLEALPSPRTSSSQISIPLLVTTSRSDYHSVDQASSTHNISLQPALFSNYPPGPTFITGSRIPSMPTMSVPMLPTNIQSFDSTISEPANTIHIGTDMNSSTSSRPCRTKIKTSPSLQTNLPTVNSETPPPTSNDNLAGSTEFPEIVGGSTLSHFKPTSFAPLQPASDAGPGSTISRETFSRGQESRPSTPSYSINFPTTLATSGSSTATPSQQVSLQSSLNQSYIGQTSSSQSPPQNASASPATVFVSSSTKPSIPAIPPASSMPSVSDSPPINPQSSVLPTTSILPPAPITSSNITVTTPPATHPDSAGPPYANTSQALNLTNLGSMSHLPSRTHYTVFPTQGPYSPPRPPNGSLHTVMCFANTTSTTHILANVCLTPMPKPLFPEFPY